ncbi:MAG: TlpA family protein disulfide reductase [Burkholderiales bacterium]
MFWAIWCAPCLEEIPKLVVLAEDRRDIQVFGVAIDWQVLQFAEGMFISYPIVLGDVSALPTSFIYAVGGKLVARQAGTLIRRQFIRLIDRLC